MGRILLADAEDIVQWASRRDAQADLPQLIRKLVQATTTQLEQLHFRTGGGVQVEGWDGIVLAPEGSPPFVPQGCSAWELSTHKNVKRKADEDYRKRSQEPRSLCPASTSYVFVTARRWKNKAEWAEERRRDGIWRDVRAYDADDLAAWLERAPAVHLWFSRLIGKHPMGASDLATYWECWSCATRVPLNPDLLVAGRGNAVSQVLAWLDGAPTALGLRADTRDEAVAFLVACLFQLPVEKRENIITRAVVVSDPLAWQQMTEFDSALVLVLMLPDRRVAGQAVAKGHHVLIPLEWGEPALGDTVSLPRLSREGAEKALVAMGIPEPRATDLAATARRSLGALRRELAVHPGALTPEWAKSDTCRSLIPALLAGRWDHENASDREVLSRLAGREYSEIHETLIGWANKPDPPVRLVGHVWLVAARQDAWLLLARYLTTDDLKRLEAVALDVLGELDPKFELPAGERWAARVYGKTLTYSDHLREGLAETLALMAALSKQCPLAFDSRTGQDWATRMVAKLLNQSDWRFWASLSPLLPLLAEAAPIAFLAAVERELSQPNPSFANLFTEEEVSPHTGLQGALEVLAWSPDYLGQAALLLAKLARLDPGGRPSNRPVISLREIFLPWHPCTTASLEQRLTIIDSLRRRESKVAWDLMVSLLTTHVASPTAKPKWHDWVPEERATVTEGERWRITVEITHRLLEDAGKDGARWSTLIEAFDQLPRAAFESVVNRLFELSYGDIPQSERRQIWDALRRLISRHFEFPGADWALPQEVIRRLREAYERFQPDDPIERRSWLFARRPHIPEEGCSGWQQREQAILQARARAVEELFAAGGLPALEELAGRVEDPFGVGEAVAHGCFLDRQHEAELLSRWLGSPNSALRDMALGFLSRAGGAKGKAWLDSLRSGETWKRWTPQQRADYYLCLPFSKPTWDALETEVVETQELYWRNVRIFGHGALSAEDYERATLKLKECGRVASAIQFLAVYVNKVHPSPRLVAQVLEHAVQGTHREPINWSSLTYDIGELLRFVELSGQIEEDRLARLEWYFLPLLRYPGHPPRILHKLMAEKPQFFVEVLKLVYGGEEDETAESTTEDQHIRARRGFDLLYHWRRPPGVNEDGSVDPERLRTWISQARQLVRATGLEVFADHHIGQVLAHYPVGTDGAWPHEALRDLLEEVTSDEIEEGIRIGIHNRRGVVTRSIGEGGTQERSIAKLYRDYARLARDKWPRVARLMERLANDYEAEARWQDLWDELDEDLWG